MSRAHSTRAMLLLGAILALASSARAGLPGDVYLDCHIDVADAVLLERSLAGLVTLTDEQRTNANLVPIGGVASDDVVDAGDLVTLKRILAGDASKPTPVYSAPELDAISSTTSTNPIVISGSVASPQSGMLVTLYVNGRALPYEASVDPSTGRFAFDSTNGFWRVPLVDGPNQITAIVRKGTTQSCSSARQTTTYTVPPASVLTHSTDRNFSGSLNDSNPLHSTTMVWTPALSAGNAYVVTGDLTIGSGQSLYIEPGVQVKFAKDARLIVSSGGTLKILGAPGQEVNLVPDVPGSCGDATRWGGIEVGSPTSPQVRVLYTRMSCVTYGVHISSGGNATANNNEITDFSIAGGFVELGASFGGFSFNTLVGTGIGIDTEDNSFFLRGNTINASAVGIKTTLTQTVTSRTVSIEKNVITGSSTAGILIAGAVDSVFSRNTVTGNCRGILLSADNQQPRPTFVGNSIFNNNACNCSAGSRPCKDFTYADNGQSPPDWRPLYGCGSPPPPGWIDATGNWWGSTDPAFIQSRIDQVCGSTPVIDYAPFLSAPFDQAGFWIGPPQSYFIADSYFVSGDPVPGTLTDANKPATDREWVLDGTVVVPPGATLTIPDGQILKFTRHSQLVVQGTLVVQDLNGSDVVFTGLVPPGADSEPGDWDGIRVEATGNATIRGAVIQYAARGIEARRNPSVPSQRAHVSLRDSQIEFMTEAGVILDHVDSSSQVVDTVIDGTLDPGPPVQSVKDNAARNIVGIQIIDSFDNCTPSTCGSISGNTIQRLVTGIHVRGASDPRILDNVITENIWGIWLQQTSTGAPNPVINQNRIFDNHGQTFVPYKDLEEDQTFRLCSTQGGSNLCLSDYSTTGTTTVIDAQQNYWGVLTPDEVRASVKITEGERVAVDVSQFTDGQQPPNIIGPANLLSAVMVDISAAASGPGTLQDVGGPVIRPSIVDTDRLAISYSLQRAANVLVEIFRESDNTLTATPLYSFPLQSRAAGGPYTQLWDGKDSSQHWVPDGAYAFVITAKDPMSGSVLDRYDPPANQDVRNESAPSNYKTLIGDRGAGDRGVGTLSTFNSFVNDYLTYNYVLNDYPAFGHGKFSSKVTAKVYYRATGTGDCDAAGNLSGGVLIATPWVNKPLWVASHVFVWDGRADHAVGSFEPGQLIPEVVQTPSDGPDFCVFFEVPQALKPSHVIVANTQPTITGTGLAPEIEVRADPYLIQPTYDQSSKLEFKIDQDSYVTLLIFPPGQQSVDDGDAISIIPIDGNPTTVDVDAVPGNTAFPYYWKGHADGVGESRKLSATYNGPFTFALKAVNARDSTLTSVYRGVINVRGEGEAH